MSLVVSFTLTPMLASRFYKNGVEEPKGKLWSRLDAFEAQTIAKYDVLLRKCIEKPKKLVLGVLAAFAVAVALVPLGIVGSEYMPRTDESAIQVNIELLQALTPTKPTRLCCCLRIIWPRCRKSSII